MEPSCVHQSLIPGTTRLFTDFLYHPERVRAFYSSTFNDPTAFQSARKQLQFPLERRRGLVEALREQNGNSVALDKLALPETVAIVTGQQVGLLSGPCYTIFKALTAVKLARHLESEGIPAVPVFWLASEDHDLAEVDHAWIFDRNTKPVRIGLANTPANGGPVGNVAVERLPLEEAEAALGGLPYASEVLALVRSSYGSGATLGAAFKSFLQSVLSEFGLLYLDPLAPAIRQLARPFLEETVERVPQLLDGLKSRNRDLLDAGYHSQVNLDDGASLLFLLEHNKRTPVRWKDGRFSTRDKSFAPSEFRSLAGQLSPNALLRPVMQDYLLPTLSYVGGPAEIAYMAQGQILYEKLLGRMPVLFPRNSFTLLDARAQKLLERYGLHLPDLLEIQEKVKARIASQLVPQNLAAEFSSLGESMSDMLSKLETQLAQFDPTLKSAASKSGAKMRYQLHKLAEKTARETLRRDTRSSADADYLVNLIYPHRRLQERFYSIVPFLAKHGLDLPARVFEVTQVACPDHMVRTV